MKKRRRNPKQPTKRVRRLRRLAKRKRKTNPDSRAVIMIRSRSAKNPKRFYYDGINRFVENRDDAKKYPNRKAAKAIALQLIAKHVKLNRWDVYVHGGH